MQNAVTVWGAVARDSKQACSVLCMPTSCVVLSAMLNMRRSQKVMLGVIRHSRRGYLLPSGHPCPQFKAKLFKQNNLLGCPFLVALGCITWGENSLVSR